MTIQDFISKAKYKIAEIAGLIAEDEFCREDIEIIELLSNFLECYNDELYNLSGSRLQDQIDILASKAKLVNVPVIEFSDIENIRIPVYLGGGIIGSVYDIPDYLTETKKLIADNGGGSTLHDISFTVSLGGGKTLGKYTNGQTVNYKGKTVGEIIKDLAVENIPPTYTLPQLLLNSGGHSSKLEAGTTITKQYGLLYLPNDAGPATSFKINRNGSTVKEDSVPFGYTENYVLGDETLNYQGVVTYSEGPTKNGTDGNPYPATKIQAGSVSSNMLTIKGSRFTFFGNGNSGSSTGIRSLGGLLLDLGEGSSFSINIPIGAINVVFAYPSNLKDVSSVKYVEGLNADVKSIFNQTIVEVAGANGIRPIMYKVYTYTPAEAYTAPATYTVTI